MHLDTVALEDIDRPGPHVPRQQDRDALLLENPGDVRLAPASLSRGQGAGLLHPAFSVGREEAVLGAMPEVVIDLEVKPSRYGDESGHDFDFFLR